MTLLLLGDHLDIQEKLRREILEVYDGSNSGKLDYDTLVNLPYLDAVCRETLRLCVAHKSLSLFTRADE